MRTPSPKLIERAAESLGNDLTQLHQVGSKVAGKIIADSGKMVKRARYKLRNGATLATEIEGKVVSDFQSRPLAYLLVAFGLACVVALKIALNRRRYEGDSDR